MASKSALPVCATILLLLLAVSCGEAGGVGSSQSPVIPDVQDENSGLPELTAQNAEEAAGHYLWGYYLVHVDPTDPDKSAISIQPLRQVSNHWNVLKFLEQGPCTNCFRLVPPITPTGNGTILVRIEVRHPFPIANLTGFDVRGIAMFNGSHGFPGADLLTSDRALGEGEVVNADGFTTLYNPSTAGAGPGGFQGYLKGKLATKTAPNCALNAYKRFVSDDPANTRNAFYAGDAVVVEYEVDMPDGPFVFGYAIDASWAPPLVKPVTDPMTQFGPEANCPEPWRIDVDEQPVGQGLTDEGGATNLVIDVYDRQGKDSHDAPMVECPELWDDVLEASWTADYTGYSRYEVVVENENLAGVGRYKCLISVEDHENASAPDWLDLTAYAIVHLEVIPSPGNSPIAIAGFGPSPQTVCEPVAFFNDGSYDPDGGEIVLYEWDWDNDGVFDEQGPNLEHVWTEPGLYFVQFRVTDDESATGTLASPLAVPIDNVPPTAVAFADKYVVEIDETVNFSGEDSSDNDCGGFAIVGWEWDFHADGSYEATGSKVSGQWGMGGVDFVQLRVTDDEGEQDLLDTPLEILVLGPPIAMAAAEPAVQVVGEPVHFFDDGSYDPDGGLILAYEWDWENDGSYDESGATVYHTWYAPGIYYVQFRVPDDEGDFDELDVPIVVLVHEPPVAISDPPGGSTLTTVSTEVFFRDNGSFDPDGGPIVMYEWDWECDGIYDEEGPDVSHTWDLPGQYFVQFRVTDDEGATDELEFPIEIIIESYEGWAQTWGGPDEDDMTQGVAFGTGGCVYAVGRFVGTVDFDPGPGVWELSSNTPDYLDAFVVKLGPSGNLLWAMSFGGTSSDEAIHVCTDGYDLFVAGGFRGLVDFDPGPGVTTAQAVGSEDAFLAKFSLGGAFSWVRTWGSPLYDFVSGLHYDGSGNLYVPGAFYGSCDFDTGPGTDIKTSAGDADCYIIKHNTSGQYMWSSTWGGTAGDEATGIVDNGSGLLYVAGRFFGTCDFDPGSGVYNRTSAGQSDAFVSQFDTSGNWYSVKVWGASVYDDIWGIARNEYSDVFTTGEFGGTVDFDPGGGTANRTAAGGKDAFLSKLDQYGNFVWVRTWGGAGQELAYSMAYDPDLDSAYVTGDFEGTADFDPGAGVDNRASAGTYDAYLISISDAGAYNWASTWGGGTFTCGMDVAASYNIIVGGFYTGTTDFDPGGSTDWHTSNGGADACVSKFYWDGYW